MSKLEELINELCPDGVEYKKIKEIAEVGTGSSNGNEAIENGKYPFFIRSQTVKSKNDWEYDEEALIIPGEGGIGEIYHYINGKYAIHQRVYRIHFMTEIINVKFAFYYFHSCFKAFILQKAVSATVTSIRKPMIEDFYIPIPPLPLQKEIVRILDNFMELTTELTTELTARRKQYDYYRDILLKKGDTVAPSMALADICLSIADGDHMAPPKASEGVPFITISSIDENKQIDFSKTMFVPVEYYNKLDTKRKAQKDDILYTVVGSFGTPVHISFDRPFVFQRHIAILRINQEVVKPKYLYYAMQSSDFYKQADLSARGAAQRTIGLSSLAKMHILVPSLSEQQRIVNILDRFDSLCNDISSGLPAEIKARKQQYEYYRDKLLTFSKAELEV